MLVTKTYCDIKTCNSEIPNINKSVTILDLEYNLCDSCIQNFKDFLEKEVQLGKMKKEIESTLPCNPLLPLNGDSWGLTSGQWVLRGTVFDASDWPAGIGPLSLAEYQYEVPQSPPTPTLPTYPNGYTTTTSSLTIQEFPVNEHDNTCDCPICSDLLPADFGLPND